MQFGSVVKLDCQKIVVCVRGAAASLKLQLRVTRGAEPEARSIRPCRSMRFMLSLGPLLRRGMPVSLTKKDIV